MKKSIIYKVFLAISLILMPFLSSPAEAALGDFLFKWGGEYVFRWPSNMAVDSSGNVYVVNSNGIYVFSNAGTFIRKFGSTGSGDGQFSNPGGIALDGSGNVYVVDTGNHRVQVFSGTGTFLRKWGTYGTSYSQFRYPGSIAVDSSGNVYVTESGTDFGNNNRVQVFNNTGTFIRELGSYGTGDGQFSRPGGIAVDSSGNVYVIDGTRLQVGIRVQVFSNTGAFLRKWGTYGSGDGQFKTARGIAVDSSGNVYVTEDGYDYGNNRVQVFNNTGAFVGKWGSYGSGNGQFNWSSGIAVDGSGNVYVADKYNDRVQVFTNTGAFLNKWGAYDSGLGLFSSPYGVALDADGNVYVADTYNHRVQVFNATGAFLRVWGGYGVGEGKFRYPFDIAVDSRGDVYVADLLNSKVQVFNGSGTFLRQWGVINPYGNQFSIAVDSNSNVYVGHAAHNSVQIFSSTGALLRQLGVSAISMAFDSSGNAYLLGDGKVRVFSSTGEFLREWGGYGYVAGKFRDPWGIAVDSSGQVYVSDRFGPKVQIFSNTGTFLGSWGTPGSGDGQFNIPTRLVVNPGGKVYVADSYNHRIQVFEGYNACVLTAVAGIDQTVEQTSPAGTSLVLNGSATSQGCTGTFTYEWSWSGGSATGASPTVLLPPGTTNVTLAVKSGTYSATDTVAITVRDTKPPATTALINGTMGNNGWYLSIVGVYLSAADSGSGVQEVRHLIDEAETVTAGSTASFSVNADGAHTASYYAIDKAGNPEVVHPLTVNIDKTPPTLSAAQNPLPDANSWNNTEVTVSFDCADATSGIAGCTPPVTITSDGESQIVSGTATDKAGNSVAASVNLNIDKTLPAISINGVSNGATYILGTAPAAGYFVTDNLSGMATQNAMLTGGNANGAGTYTYTVTATDRAGNAANAVALYNVAYGFGGFLPPVSLGKPFKLGSTIPVKFQLTDAGGAYIPSANATIMVQKFSGDQPVDDPIEVTSTSAADTGNMFRYSAMDNLYIYNLSTAGLSEGTWQIQATLDDGTVKTAFIVMKVK